MAQQAFTELVQDAMKVYERDMKALNLILYPQGTTSYFIS